MTETEIRTALATLTPAQRRMLTAIVQGQPCRGRGQWNTLDALVRKGLLIGRWLDEAQTRLIYEPSALVATLVTHLGWGQPKEDAP